MAGTQASEELPEFLSSQDFVNLDPSTDLIYNLAKSLIFPLGCLSLNMCQALCLEYIVIILCYPHINLKNFFLNLFPYLFLAMLVHRCCVWAFSSQEHGATLQLWCEGFSLQWLLLLGSAGSRHSGFDSCSSQALEHRLNNCGSQAQMLCGIQDLPKSGIEPVSPALAGRFFTTEPWKPLCMPAQSPIVSNSL